MKAYWYSLLSVLLIVAVFIDYLIFTSYRVDIVLMSTYIKHILLMFIAYYLRVLYDEKNTDAGNKR